MAGKLVILGASNPEVVRLYERCREAEPSLELLGFIDNDAEKHGKEFYGFPILGGHEVLAEPRFRDVSLVNCITRDAKTRKGTSEQLEKYKLPFASLLHPSVDLRRVHCGVGLYIQANVVVEAETVLDDHVAIFAGTTVGHETDIGYASFVAPGCTVCGCVTIGQEVFVGAGAVIQPRVVIGDGAVIHSGAVVTSDVEAHAVVGRPPVRVPGGR